MAALPQQHSPSPGCVKVIAGIAGLFGASEIGWTFVGTRCLLQNVAGYKFQPPLTPEAHRKTTMCGSLGTDCDLRYPGGSGVT